MPRQLTFDWPTGVSLAKSDFFVSVANENAYLMLQNPAIWPSGKMALTGPAGSGKSHLARIFAQAQEAVILDLATDEVTPQSASAVVIENLEAIAKAQEEPLFHLHNNLLARGGVLLVTSGRAPAAWPIALPDLATRMQAVGHVEITDPDDALLSAVVMKQFADRQMNVGADVIGYVVSRMDRSFAAAQRLVEALDRAALAQGRRITRPLASEVLDNLR